MGFRNPEAQKSDKALDKQEARGEKRYADSRRSVSSRVKGLHSANAARDEKAKRANQDE